MNEPQELSIIGDSPHSDDESLSIPQTGFGADDSAEDHVGVPAVSQTGLEDDMISNRTPDLNDLDSGLGEPASAENDGVNKRPRINQRKYIKPEEHIVSIDGTPGYTTQTEKAQNDLLDIVESLKGNRILTDTLQGVERSTMDGEPFAVLNHGFFKVIIPASEMIDLPDDLNGRTPNELYYMLLHRRMGAEIDYIVKGISQDDAVAAASRKEAMAVKRKRYYFGKDRAGNNLLYEDVCAEARVTCVFGGGIVVDLFGIETYIPLRELSWQRISRAQGRFAPGDRVVVRIQELDRSDRDNIHVRSSVRLAMKNPYTEAMRKYSVDCCYTGIVTHIDPTGIFVAMDGGIDCLCAFPARGRPPIGSRVSVYIIGKNEEDQKIWGAIIHAALPIMD